VVLKGNSERDDNFAGTTWEVIMERILGTRFRRLRLWPQWNQIYRRCDDPAATREAQGGCELRNVPQQMDPSGFALESLM